MHRGVLRSGVFLWVWMACAPLWAHGLPPDAYALVSRDSAGLRAVALSAGVALRRSAQRYQYVCPAAWGDQFTAPVAALADGTIVIGASRGLTVLAEDGSLRPHPDPAAVGRSSDVVRSANGVFALRTTAQGKEVLAVDAQQVRVLWQDTKNWSSMAALGDTLVLLRESDRVLEQMTISAAGGAELERQSAVVELPTDNVIVRTDATAAYALVVFRDGSVVLGSLRMNTFDVLARAEVFIAGPLSLNGATLLALDGQLMDVVGGQPAPLADEHNVVCLGQDGELSYACDADGIVRLHDRTLGEPLFDFSWLSAPDLERVPAGDLRMLCVQQWQDLLLDLQLNGTTLLDASLPGAPVDAAVGGGGAALEAGKGAIPVAGAGGVAVPQPAQARSSGCGVAPGRASEGARALLLGLVTLGWFLSRRKNCISDRES